MKITSKNNIPRLYLMGNQYHIAHLEADNRSGNFSQKDLDGVPKLNLYTLTSDDVLTTRQLRSAGSTLYTPSFDEYGNKYDILSDVEVDESPTILHDVVRQPADDVRRSWLMDDGISKAAM